MLTLAQVQPVAYMGDGFIVCLKCGDKAGMPVKDQIIAYDLEYSFEEDGITCDDCGEVLVEPYEEDEPEEDEDEDAPLPLQGVCKDCGNGTLNNELAPAFHDNGADQLVCNKCFSAHLDLL